LKNPNTDIIDYEKTYRKLHSPILNKQMSSKEFFKFQEKFQPSKISRVNHLLKKNYDVLEIGSSTGNFLNSIKNLVNCSVGIELDKKHMEFSKKHCKLEVYNKPIEKLKLDQKFDIIFMFQVFEIKILKIFTFVYLTRIIIQKILSRKFFKKLVLLENQISFNNTLFLITLIGF
jgi:16S rRNA A1518/A1519 N6-dimethyltransferase RsmA/KsgA/DIM1 with predicted DNA glycosylase/AP lyase activity